jgi:membrane fusion protein (multidrug efflux system)
MMRRWFTILLTVVLIFSAIYVVRYLEIRSFSQKMATAKPGAAAVGVSKARAVMWQPSINSVGQLQANQGTTIKSQSGGVVTDINIPSGRMMPADYLLVTLDHEALKAEMSALRADLTLARTEYRRYRRLAAQQNVSAQVLDSKRTAFQRAQSNLQKAHIEYRHKFIRTPFACHLGLSHIHRGQLIQEGQSIVDCEDIRILKLYYSIPQQYLGQLQTGQPITLTVDAYPGVLFAGQLTAVDPKIGENTRSINLEARVRNSASHHLLPGMLVTVSTPTGKKQGVVMVPITAIHRTLYGNYVYVVRGGKVAPKVKLQRVRLGQNHQGMVIVEKGVSAGETVVSAGQSKLRDGATIRIVSIPEAAKQ